MFSKRLTAVIVFCFALTAEASKTEWDLRLHLFEGTAYDKLVRPVEDPHHAVPTSVYITPIAIRDVDEAHHSITLDSWLVAIWHDDYLKWNPSDFNGIQSFNLPASEVWTPDLSIHTGTPDSSQLPTVRTNVVIKSDGEVLWVPPYSIHNRCPEIVEGANRIECDIVVLSWTYDVTQLDLNVYTRGNESLSDFEDKHPVWKLESYTTSREIKQYSCCPEPWSIIRFHIVLEKRTVGV